MVTFVPENNKACHVNYWGLLTYTHGGPQKHGQEITNRNKHFVNSKKDTIMKEHMRKDTFYWPIFPRKFGQKNCLKLKPSHFLVTTVAKKKQNCTKHRLLPKSLNRLHSETKYVLHLIFLIARMTISSPPWLSLRNAKTVVQMAHGWNYHKSSQRTFQHGKSIGQNTRSLIM